MLRVREGGVTVTIDDGLDRFVRGLISRTETSLVRAMREELREVAAEARAAWYGPRGVTRQTGASGDIVVVETVDIDREELRFSVGSTDDRTSRGKPVPVYVHRPGRLSTVLRECTVAEYFAAPKSMRGPWLPGNPRKPQLFRPNPKASDGKPILAEFVKRPTKAAVKAIASRASVGISRG
jgi:hypothetical protein